MLIGIAVFVISFIQSYLATREVHAIAHIHRARATFWSGVRSTVSFSFLMIVIKIDCWYLIVPYTLGDMLATNIAVRNSAKVAMPKETCYCDCSGYPSRSPYDIERLRSHDKLDFSGGELRCPIHYGKPLDKP